MAIKLVVEEYCQNCSRFYARVEKYEWSNSWGGGANTTITCENAEACAHVARGFKELIENIKHKED